MKTFYPFYEFGLILSEMTLAYTMLETNQVQPTGHPKFSELRDGRPGHDVGALTTPEIECKAGVGLAVNTRDLRNWGRIGCASAPSDADLCAFHVYISRLVSIFF